MANIGFSLPSSSRSLPRRFGHYVLFDQIGKGGMAEIYLARADMDLGASRLCVVKQITSDFASHPEFASMLIHEAKLAARLNHPNVVQVFDLGREAGELFIAMEYVEGIDLNALLRQCSQAKVPLPTEFALLIAAHVLKGLDHAHRCRGEGGNPLGIVHRDVSPSNVLVSIDGEIKLCDFGIAHANDVVGGFATDGIDEAIKGKAGYMSPEHARGGKLDARSDVFAAGIVLWELVAGRRMYRSEPGRPTLLDQARAAEIPALPLRGIPREEAVRAVIFRALEKNPSDRFSSAAEMLQALEAILSEAKLTPSPLRLGQWLVENFGMEAIFARREREHQLRESGFGVRSRSGIVPASKTAIPAALPAPPPLPMLLDPWADSDEDDPTFPGAPPALDVTPPPTPLAPAVARPTPTPPIALARLRLASMPGRGDVRRRPPPLPHVVSLAPSSSPASLDYVELPSDLLELEEEPPTTLPSASVPAEAAVAVSSPRGFEAADALASRSPVGRMATLLIVLTTLIVLVGFAMVLAAR